jgi:hypothetical protein
VSRDLNSALHQAWWTLSKARSIGDPQRWTGIEGDLYRALKDLHEAAEKAGKE